MSEQIRNTNRETRNGGSTPYSGFSGRLRSPSVSPHPSPLVSNFGFRISSFPRRRIERAFTLFELMVVIAIMVIIAGVTIPKFARTLSRSKARDEANRLLSVVRYGQGMAALQRATYWLRINLDTASYSLERGAGRGDDFDASDDQLVAGGYSGLFPGDLSPQSSTAVADEQSGAGGEGTRVAGEGRSRQGRVDIFDETQHTLPLGVVFTKIDDNRGSSFTAGEFSVPLDPRGAAQDATVYLGGSAKDSDVYSIHIGANGLTEINVDRTRR